MPSVKTLVLPVVLLLALSAEPSNSASWDEERLQWLQITKPHAKMVQLNCTSEYIYPFYLLNDSSVIGALDSRVKRLWWLLPDGRQINGTYDDGNRLLVDHGVGLLVRQVDDSAHGLYHCAVEANTMINETLFNMSTTTVYYYKRGLNLYGADVYGGSAWEKYKRNTLIGSLTAGTFLALLAGYVLLDRLGIFAKCAGRSNVVDSLGGGDANGGMAVAPTGAAEATEMKAAPETGSAAASGPASPVRSTVSMRSKRSAQAAADTAETVA